VVVSFGTIIWSALLVLLLFVPALSGRPLWKVAALLALSLVLTIAQVQVGEPFMTISAISVIVALGALMVWAHRQVPKEDAHKSRVERAKKQRDERRAKGLKW
jgi:ABC-type nickel/cobalt efflux system permease component RcnA